MGRLTKRHSNGYAHCGNENPCKEDDCFDCSYFHDMTHKLARYEDLQEAGRLVVLPCKVGDTVYMVDGDEEQDWIDEYEIKYFYVSSRGVNRIYGECGTLTKNFRPKNFGKTVFLTLEEAEAALKGGGQDG